MRINLLRGKLFRVFAFSILLGVVSCSKKTDIVPQSNTYSNAKELINISVLKNENSTISGDAFAYKTGLKFYITVPLGSNISNVKVNFNTSNKATVKINGITLPNNIGNVDLTKTITATVFAEDGSSSLFTILAQVGIKEIDALIYPFIEKYAIPAASYAIAKNSIESVVYKNASGFANTATKNRAEPSYLFRLASMTKQHTSIAIMSLIQEGKLDINDLVFGPTGLLKASFQNVGPMSAKVTVKHLLEHTAGYSGDPMFSTTYSGFTLDQRIQVMLNSAQIEPGEKFTYYNMGYGTLGKIIEVVSGMSYENYLKAIYAPLSLSKFRLAATLASNVPSDEAVCYGQGSSSPYGSDLSVYKAAGGIAINTEDLFKVLYAIDGGSIRTDILSTESRTLMFTPSSVFPNYAKGWRTNHSLFSGYYHGGNLAGTATFWIYGTTYSAAILLNSRSYDDAFDVDLILLTNNIMKKAVELNL